jgi:hypothetical protein
VTVICLHTALEEIYLLNQGFMREKAMMMALRAQLARHDPERLAEPNALTDKKIIALSLIEEHQHVVVQLVEQV